MKTIMRMLLIAGFVSAPYGIAKADPGVRGLIQVQDVPYYDQPSVEIFTDRDWYAVGEAVCVTVTVDRPSFVTVYNIDAGGYARRLTEDAHGVWVTPGRPLVLPERSHTRLVTTGPGGEEELVAVASPVRFVSCDLPFYGSGSPSGFLVPEHDRNGYVRRVNARLVGQRDCGPRSVARTTFWVEPCYRSGSAIRIGAGIFINIGFEIPLGALVYVDGAYCGRGPSALMSHATGRHKVTVCTDSGHKFTRTVDFDATRRFRSHVEADGKSQRAPRANERSKKR